jgi:CO/xanthine dehydrogenase FAD-binding subunit
MRSAPFRYLAPTSAAEALAMLAEHGEEARLLAGGQSLVPLMNLRMGKPRVIVDLNDCRDLAHIDERDDGIVFGAMVRQIDAQTSSVTLARCPLVAQGLAHAGPIAIRNRGTVGGTLAHNDRTAELPGVAVALDATLVIDGVNGRREVAAADFFVADLMTAVQPGEMLREVRMPAGDGVRFTTFLEVGLRERDMALVGLAVAIDAAPGGGFGKVHMAVTGVDGRPVRLVDVEREAARGPLDGAALGDFAAMAAAAVDPVSDVHATARYRKHVVGALVVQALEQAVRWRSAHP